MAKRRLKCFFPDQNVNIAIRSFPKTVQRIQEKLKLNNGGDSYLFFTTNFDNQILVSFARKF